MQKKEKQNYEEVSTAPKQLCLTLLCWKGGWYFVLMIAMHETLENLSDLIINLTEYNLTSNHQVLSDYRVYIYIYICNMSSLRITNVFYNCSDLTRSICESRVAINGEVEWMKGYIYVIQVPLQ